MTTRTLSLLCLLLGATQIEGEQVEHGASDEAMLAHPLGHSDEVGDALRPSDSEALLEQNSQLGETEEATARRRRRRRRRRSSSSARMAASSARMERSGKARMAASKARMERSGKAFNRRMAASRARMAASSARMGRTFRRRYRLNKAVVRRPNRSSSRMVKAQAQKAAAKVDAMVDSGFSPLPFMCSPASSSKETWTYAEENKDKVRLCVSGTPYLSSTGAFVDKTAAMEGDEHVGDFCTKFTSKGASAMMYPDGTSWSNVNRAYMTMGTTDATKKRFCVFTWTMAKEEIFLGNCKEPRKVKYLKLSVCKAPSESDPSLFEGSLCAQEKATILKKIHKLKPTPTSPTTTDVLWLHERLEDQAKECAGAKAESRRKALQQLRKAWCAATDAACKPSKLLGDIDIVNITYGISSAATVGEGASATPSGVTSAMSSEEEQEDANQLGEGSTQHPSKLSAANIDDAKGDGEVWFSRARFTSSRSQLGEEATADLKSACAREVTLLKKAMLEKDRIATMSGEKVIKGSILVKTENVKLKRLVKELQEKKAERAAAEKSAAAQKAADQDTIAAAKASAAAEEAKAKQAKAKEEATKKREAELLVAAQKKEESDQKAAAAKAKASAAAAEEEATSENRTKLEIFNSTTAKRELRREKRRAAALHRDAAKHCGDLTRQEMKHPSQQLNVANASNASAQFGFSDHGKRLRGLKALWCTTAGFFDACNRTQSITSTVVPEACELGFQAANFVTLLEYSHLEVGWSELPTCSNRKVVLHVEQKYGKDSCKPRKGKGKAGVRKPSSSSSRTVKAQAQKAAAKVTSRVTRRSRRRRRSTRRFRGPRGPRGSKGSKGSKGKKKGKSRFAEHNRGAASAAAALQKLWSRREEWRKKKPEELRKGSEEWRKRREEWRKELKALQRSKEMEDAVQYMTTMAAAMIV